MCTNNSINSKELSDTFMDKNSRKKLDKLATRNTPKDITEKIHLHDDILTSIHKMYINKNHDYGDSVHDTYEKYGLVSFLVRMEDKLNRVRNLYMDLDNIKISDEKIEDTLLDLANYSILAVMELKLDKNNNDIDTHITMTRDVLEQYKEPPISY